MTNVTSGAGSAPATTKAPEAPKTEVTSGKQLAESIAAKSASQDDKPTQQNPDKTTEGTNPTSNAAQNNTPSPDGPATGGRERRIDGLKKFEAFARVLRDAETPESHVLFGLNGIPFTVGDFKDVWREIN